MAKLCNIEKIPAVVIRKHYSYMSNLTKGNLNYHREFCPNNSIENMVLQGLEIHEAKVFFDSLGEEKKLAKFDFDQVRRAEFATAVRVNNQIAGVIGIKKTYRIFPTLFIVVKKEYQGGGVGNRLMNKEIEFAREAYSFLTLSTFDNGRYDAAIHLYEKFGFQLFLKNKTRIWMCTSFNSRGRIICKYLPMVYPVVKFLFHIMSRSNSK